MLPSTSLFKHMLHLNLVLKYTKILPHFFKILTSFPLWYYTINCLQRSFAKDIMLVSVVGNLQSKFLFVNKFMIDSLIITIYQNSNNEITHLQKVNRVKCLHRSLPNYKSKKHQKYIKNLATISVKIKSCYWL